MESTVCIKEMSDVMPPVKEEPRDNTEIRENSFDWQAANVQLNYHCNQLLTVKKEMLPQKELMTRIKEEVDQKLMKMVKKEQLANMEMAMAQQLSKANELLLDEESVTTFASAHQSEQLVGGISSFASPSLDDDYDRMPSDWFSSESSDSNATVTVSAASIFNFSIKDEPLPDDEECLSTFASTQLASPSIIIKGETCPCTGDCLDCQAKRSPPCPECGKTFAKNSALIIHLRVHTGERPFVCDQCPKAFSQLGALTRHQLTHQAVRSRSFLCTAEGCGKAFLSKGELKIHFRLHTGEKPYKCNSCGKAFTQSSKLTVHLRSHTGARPYRCNNCEKIFTTSGNLNVHLRSHTGAKPYQCPLCPKAFATSSAAKRHQRTVHARSL